MARAWSKFCLLMWKNWVLQKRHPVQTAIEIIAPVFFTVLLVLIRSLVIPDTYDTPTIYPPFSAASLNGSAIELMLNITRNFSFPIHPRLLYSPNNTIIDNIMRNVASKLEAQASSCESEADLVQRFNIMQDAEKAITLAGVVFPDNLGSQSATTLPADLQIKFRFPSELRMRNMTGYASSWFTYTLFPQYQTPGPRDESTIEGQVPGYYTEGFLALQHHVSASLVEYLGIDPPEIKLQRFPYPPYLDDPLLTALQSFIPLIIMLSLAYTCVSIVKTITTEKEMQLKEAMKIMGLPNWLHWSAWFIKSYILLIISVILMVIMIKVPWYPDSAVSVFTNTDWSVIFVFMLVYAATTICFCFMISVFFTKANTAATISGLGWFILLVPFLFLQDQYYTTSFSSKMGASIMSNTAMAFAMQIIIMYEGTGNGLQWDTIWEPITPDDNIQFGHLIIMMVIDGILYFLIAMYVENVFPGTYGVPKPWYFPVQPSFWLGKKHKSDPLDFPQKTRADPLSFEEEPTSKPGIEIKNLRKLFHKKVAVNNLSMNMYEDQITVLLGHNGAGKTTTINMLIGMITPTSGSAKIDDYEISTEMESIREGLGFCPQHNILFNEMTVKEHIYFFAKLKGLDDERIKVEARKYIMMLDLEDKANKQAHTLSGGMKRKLSAAVALCGRSKIVIFDEPTAGMDPAARRTLWDLLQEDKKDRTILLTTHFMDEADLLGDRIAIMAGGELQCCGSSFFLKKRYGAGYRLIIAKGPNCNVDAITRLLRQHIPEIYVNQNIASELTYLLEEEKSSVFEPMLRDLEENKDRLNILSFGVSLTTMEEVFIKVGSDFDANMESDQSESGSTTELLNDRKENGFSSGIHEVQMGIGSSYHLTGFKLVMNQTYAMFLKYVLHSLRSWIICAIQFFIPIFFLIISFIVARVMANTTNDQPELQLNLQQYGYTITPIELLTNDSVPTVYYETFKQIVGGEIVDLHAHPELSDMVNYILTYSAKQENLRLYRQNYIVGSTFDYNEVNSTPSLTAWFNNQPYHSPPIALNLVYNAILKSYNHSINIINHPLPYTQQSRITLLSNLSSAGFQISFNIAFSMAFAMAFYVLFHIRERVSNSKHLQYVSGANILIYWTTSYIWDIFTFIIMDISIVVVMAAFQEDGFSSAEQLGRIFLVVLSFGFAMIPLVYIASYFFDIPASGYSRVVMINEILGMALFMLVSTLRMPSLNLQSVGDTLDWVFLTFIPLYSLGASVSSLYTNDVRITGCAPYEQYCNVVSYKNPCCREADLCPDGQCIIRKDNYFDWEYPGVGRNMFFFYLDTVVFIIFLLLIELGVFKRLMYRMKLIGNKEIVQSNLSSETEDSDVAAEKKLIKSTNLDILKQNYLVVVQDLSKYYGSFLAVDRLCIGINKGECFGLLGVNGAGKTSTFKMLTGDENISSGDAYVSGFNLKTDIKKAQKVMGYCPQFDAVIQDLTGRETLRMYCLLRGIPTADIPHITQYLADELLFTQHIDKKVKEYSGGNKRKLSTAVALVGDPPVIYLDEPTAGMDPVAKRHLWNVICKLRDSGKCIVLTSHSMEECEALCTRIAIMVNGEFKCLGSTQHLKSKFAEGYTLIVKAKSLNEEVLRPIKEYIYSSFPGVVLKEEHESMLTFYIPATNITWSAMFGMMEREKQRLDIVDYSLGQTSLEQVFLTFAKKQVELTT